MNINKSNKSTRYFYLNTHFNILHVKPMCVYVYICIYILYIYIPLLVCWQLKNQSKNCLKLCCKTFNLYKDGPHCYFGTGM